MSRAIDVLNQELLILKKSLKHGEEYLKSIKSIAICKYDVSVGTVEYTKQNIKDVENAIKVLNYEQNKLTKFRVLDNSDRVDKQVGLEIGDIGELVERIDGGYKIKFNNIKALDGIMPMRYAQVEEVI